MKVLDLFSGIGGFSLGLERAGMKTVAFCEIEEFPRKVLRKHWPDVPIYEDVRELTGDRLRADGITVDLICGGFPCQDISFAGAGAGIEGERSGLWSEFARLIGEIRPRYIIVENVAALLGRGLGTVLRDLAKIGYDAEWHCIPASELGAHHHRDRLWIIAYPASIGNKKFRCSSDRKNAASQKRTIIVVQLCAMGSDGEAPILANTPVLGQQRQREYVKPLFAEKISKWKAVDAESGCISGIWAVEPSVGRVANGVPDRMDKLKGLGNAVVPQIPELIGRAILDD